MKTPKPPEGPRDWLRLRTDYKTCVTQMSWTKRGSHKEHQEHKGKMPENYTDCDKRFPLSPKRSLHPMKPVNFSVSAASLFLYSLAAALGIAADEKPAKEAAKKSDTAKSRISLTIADWDETIKLVAVQKGKVVVLDAWSTSCPPCMKEFPNLVKLHQKYGGKEVVCMSLSCDYA